MNGGETLLAMAYLNLIRGYVENLESMVQSGGASSAAQVAALLVDDAKRLQELLDAPNPPVF